MSGLAARASRWMWRDAPDRRYAIVRRSVAALIAARLAVGSYAKLVDQDAAQLKPPGFLAWMSALPPVEVLVALQVLGVVAALVAASGWGVRRPASAVARGAAKVAYPIAFLAYLYLAGVKTSGGKILHNDVLPLLVAFPLVFASENPVDRDGVPVGRRRNVGWTLNLSLLLLVIGYFLAGVAKLMHSGPAWMYSDNVRFVMYWAQQSDGVPKGFEFLAAAVGNNPVMPRVIAVTTIVFEVGAPAILVWRRLRPWFALMAVTLHIGTWLTIGLDYWGWSIAAVLVLVDWGQTEPRRAIPGNLTVGGDDDARAAAVAAHGSGVEGLLLYDGDCGFCTQTARRVEARTEGRVAISTSQAADLAPLGLTDEQVEAEVWWVAADGTAHAGYRAVAMALWSLGGLGVPAARLLLVPGVGVVAGPAYRLVARNRHRLPGASDACRIDA